MVKVKTNMPEDNQPLSPQPNLSDSPVNNGQVIQPTSSNVSPQSQPTPTIPVAPPTVPQPSVQPTGVVNGQPFFQRTSTYGSQYEQISDNKPSKWRYFFIVLGVLQALGVVLFFLVMSSIAGQTGSEFVALALFITLVPFVGLMALINLIGLPIYMRKHKPQGKGLIFGILSLVVSAILVLYGAYSVYQLRVAAPKRINELSQQSQQKIEAKQQQFIADNAKPEITKDDAIALLKSCQLKGFYYTNQTSSKADGNWAELSSTGVVLTKIDGQPYRISIADRLIPELVPIAREAQKTCGGAPQFWHDGSYE